MTWRALLERSLWGAALVVGVWSGATWDRWVPTLPASAAPGSPSPAAAEVEATTLALVTAASIAVERNPFRLDRRPAATAVGPSLDADDGIEYHHDPEPEPERTILVLRGILGGPPWEALVEGIAGRTGSVLVRPGDVVGELRVRSIGRDTVVVQAADSTWKLTLKTTWP